MDNISVSVYTHEMCDVCNAPQWVMPNGEHRCMTIQQLHDRYQLDTDALDQLQKYISGLEKQIDKYKTENAVLRTLIEEQIQGQKNFGRS